MQHFSSLGRGAAVLLLLAAPSFAARAQTGGVRVGMAGTPDASAVLDVSANPASPRGLLLPRLTQTQRDAIGSPAAGLTIFNTSTNRLNTWNGTSWDQAISATESPISYAAQTYTAPGQYTYQVPPGITSLSVDVAGARGGSNSNGTTGGAGARATTVLTVTSGETLVITVGGAGSTAGSGPSGAGYNGGGNGTLNNGGGGGASDLRRGSTRLVVAGGGGGASGSGGGGTGGLPDGTTGAGGQAGTGGTGSSPGTGYGGVGNGTAAGQGGTGTYTGGGGGYAGGGGGASGGGGGGSSYVAPTGTTGGSYGLGSTADGRVVLTPGTLSTIAISNVPGDNLGNHTATQNLNLGTYSLTGTTAVTVGNNLNLGTNQLVGNGGSTGLSITNGGSVGIGTSAPAQRLEVAGSLSSLTAGTQPLLRLNRPDNNNVKYGNALEVNVGSYGTTNVAQTQVDFRLNNGTTDDPDMTALTLRANGNVGLGTTAPLSRLSIQQVTSQSATAGQNLGELTFVGFNRAVASASIQALTKDYDDTGLLLFKTSPNGGGATERMRLTADGSVGIGATDPQAGLHIDRPESSSGTALGVLLSGGSSGNPSIELRGSGKTPYIDFVETAGLDYSTRLLSIGGTLNLNYGGAAAGKPTYVLSVDGGITATGQVRANGVVLTSDARFKTNIRPLAGALASVLALRGVRYEWNALGVRHGGTAGAGQVGLLAQEVEKIYPELVSTDAQGYKAVNYAQLTPVLIEALKEQQQQLEELRQQNTALKAQATATTAAFEARLRRLEAATGGQARR